VPTGQTAKKIKQNNDENSTRNENSKEKKRAP